MPPVTPRARTAVEIAAALLASCALSGCRQDAAPAAREIGFFLSSPHDVHRVGRVVLVELGAVDECPPDVAWDTTRALASAVQARRLFHVDVVRRADVVCRDLPIHGLEALTLEEMATMRAALGCDAVLFGRISHFQPFPCMQLGLYLKLMNLRDGKLVWGVDHIWDTTDRATERRIHEYYCEALRTGYDPLGPDLVLKSPKAFERFVTHEAAGTFPRRPSPTKKQLAAGRTLK